MKPGVFSLVSLVLAALVGAGACLIAQSLTPGGGGGGHAHSHHGAGAVDHYHEWIHAELGVSAEQDAGLAEVEAAFAERQKALKARIVEANAKLGEAILEDKSMSARVEAILGEIDAAHRELQAETIEHFFEMKPFLSDGQFEKLLGLLDGALKGVPHSHEH